MADEWREPAHFGTLSPDVIKLLCSMLEIDPSKRITTAKILQVMFAHDATTPLSAVTHVIFAAHSHRTNG